MTTTVGVGAADADVSCEGDGGREVGLGGGGGTGVDVATGCKVDVGGTRVGWGSTDGATVGVMPSTASAAVIGWLNKNARKSTAAIVR